MRTVAIIGGGGTGSAAARCAARTGCDVTVFEQFRFDHDRGSSYGGSRIIRRTYPDPLYTKLMASAYPLWEELEAQAGERLLVRCGGLIFGSEGSAPMEQTEASLRANAVGYERLSAADVRRRFPPFRLDDGQYGIYQADSGYLRASRCVQAQMRLAVSAGAELREGTRVKSIRPLPTGKALVATDADEMTFDRVLVTAGPWAARILASLNLPLTVTRQYYAHLHAPDLELFDAGRFPVWIDMDTNFYGFPRQPELPGVKVACHNQGRRVDPDDASREPAEGDLSLLTDYTARRLPELAATALMEKVCLYTNTPDEDFVIDAVPAFPGAYLCSGCSGHGFKFTALFGQILNLLAHGETVPYDLRRFHLSRFSPVKFSGFS
jgi:monomeric sarcosine oxidase